MNKREEIARAMAVADGKDPDAPAWVSFPGGHPQGICWRDQYGGKADAALDAIREPSEAMVEAAHTRLAGDGDISDLYRAMVDAARNEA